MPFHSWVARSSRPVSSGAISGASARKLTSHTVTPNSTPYSTISGGRALSWNVSASPARNATPSRVDSSRWITVPNATDAAAGKAGASAVLTREPLLPFQFAAGLLVGPEALAPAFPAAASVALGTVIHLLLSTLLGVAFLAGLALTFQLSARPPLMVLYGVLFGVTVWEVNFLALAPLIAPELTGRLDLATQLWNGIASYCLVYGPVLAVYVIGVRPG